MNLMILDEIACENVLVQVERFKTEEGDLGPNHLFGCLLVTTFNHASIGKQLHTLWYFNDV